MLGVLCQSDFFFFWGKEEVYLYNGGLFGHRERCPNIETKRHSCEVSLYTKSFIHIYKIQKMDNQ